MSAVETERLVLVPWSDVHLGDFARICADPRVVEFITGGGALAEEDVRSIHERALSLWRTYGYGPWAAFDRESGGWVGRIGLNLLEDWPGPDRWEVGFELDPRFWGRGLATEGALAAVRFGFDIAGLDRIISVTVPANRASRRVMEKCGMRRQGELEWRETTVVWYAIDRPGQSGFGWPEAPTSVPEHVVFQCTNGVVLGLFSETVFEERFGRVANGFRGVSVTIACEDAEAVHRAHARVAGFDDVFDLDERPDESGWGCGFSFRDPEGNVSDGAFKYGSEFDDRGGFVYP